MKSFEIQRMLAGFALLSAALLGAGAATAQDSLLPTVRLDVPNLSSTTCKDLPPVFTFPLVGEDADSPDGRPVKYRTLLIAAQYDTTALGEPVYITTAAEFALYAGGLLAWDDPAWSAWLDYPAAPELPQVSAAGLADQTFYLLALQVMDADGAVSVGLGYQQEVVHFRVIEDRYAPVLTVHELYLGTAVGSSPFSSIAGLQPLNFFWIADAGSYGGTLVSYRHGWDLVDPDDPNDPGWAVPPGLEPHNLYAAERSFQSGIHTFTVRVEDDAQQARLVTWELQVVPFVAASNQRPLLVIDQTIDDNSAAWIDQSGLPRDNQVYRDAYWQFLADPAGGVVGFDWNADRKSQYDMVDFEDVVAYKAVLCYARNSTNQLMFNQLRPVSGVDRYVWLDAYQQGGGNYFQVGDGSMDSFLETLPNYMTPVIFDTYESTYVLLGEPYVVGFGMMEMPDGSVVRRGPRQYPYATAGVGLLDWTSTSTKHIYARAIPAYMDRKPLCAGLKGLVLDPDFRSAHGIGSGTIADTLLTDPVIDWVDAVNLEQGALTLATTTFPFRQDEFIDANISSRPTPWQRQTCADGPDGYCVQPMFRGIARMDWVREQLRSLGDTEWPLSQYSPSQLEDVCGEMALQDYGGMPAAGARTNAQTYGWLSYKRVADKPSGRADVYWGFDPYRFDQQETRKAIRWVLEYFGLNLNP